MKKVILSVAVVLLAVPLFAVVAGTDLYVPAVGHALGASVNGVQAHWRADIWIYNPSSQAASVNVYLLLRAQANPNPDVRVITVNPGETRYLADVVFATFGKDNTYGGLRVTSNVPVVVTGVSYDANVTVTNKGTGPTGQFFSGAPADTAIGAANATDIIGLDQDGAQSSGTWRSNLAFVETTGNPVNLLLQRLDSNGTVLGSMPYSLQGREVNQVNYVVTSIVNTPGTNQRVRVTVTGGTGAVVAAGSRINNTTGDPSTVEMTGTHAMGRFEGVVLDALTGTTTDGGLKLEIGNGVLTYYEGNADLPCPDAANDYVVDFSIAQGGSANLNADGSFSTQTTIPYSNDPSGTFNITWTLAGARQLDGSWSGTLKTDTSGGTGAFAQCNATGVTRQWRANWTGNS